MTNTQTVLPSPVGPLEHCKGQRVACQSACGLVCTNTTESRNNSVESSGPVNSGRPPNCTRSGLDGTTVASLDSSPYPPAGSLGYAEENIVRGTVSQLMSDMCVPRSNRHHHVGTVWFGRPLLCMSFGTVYTDTGGYRRRHIAGHQLTEEFCVRCLWPPPARAPCRCSFPD